MKKIHILIITVVIVLLFFIVKYATYDESSNNCQYSQDARRLQEHIDEATD
ncbi:MAG: hypothetical protein U0L85_07075 [Bacilli bacterium]|nr:hypothetical protein [Bacilli bacterium]